MITKIQDPAPGSHSAVINRPEYFLGAGSYRAVYRAPDSPWVFKTPYSVYDASCIMQTDQEFFNTSLLRKAYEAGRLDPQVYIPRVKLMDVGILAMEYIPGKHPNTICFGECVCTGKISCWRDTAQEFLLDPHRGNVHIMPDGRLGLLDLSQVRHTMLASLHDLSPAS